MVLGYGIRECRKYTGRVSAPTDLRGRVLDDRYRIDRLLADGGMATVYQAFDLRLERLVALKVMHRDLVDEPGFVDRFLTEARAAARLSDPHVVTVFDRGRTDDTVYLVLEFVQGRTLRQELTWGGRLSTARALDILSSVLQGIAAAHEAGFVHGDIKPENVLLGELGGVKVADFGLARTIGPDDQRHAQLLGTAAYLAPEQATDRTPDPRSDLYSAGLLLFEMVTGHVPFRAATADEVLALHQTQQVPRPSLFVEVPPSVDALTYTATRRDPAQRYQTAAAMLAEVDRLRADIPRDTAPPRMLQEPEPVEAPTTIVRPGLPETAVQPDLPASEAAAEQAPAAAEPTPGAMAVAIPPQRPAAGPKRAPDAPRQHRRGAVITVIFALAAAVGLGAWWLGVGQTVATPNLVGKTRAAALKALDKRDLTLSVTAEEFSEVVPEGRVLTSAPGARERIRKGGTVSVVMSKGPERYDVPDLRGRTVEQARAALERTNLVLGQTLQDWSARVPVGRVKSTTPSEGTALRRGTEVAVIVSKGPEPVQVADVTGTDVESARTTLEAAGLTVLVTSVYDPVAPADTVVSTVPEPGTTLFRGDEVTLNVSKGADVVQVPSVVGMTTDDASSALESAGFTVSVSERFGVTVANRVLSQDPSGGSMAPRGSEVTLTIT